jgi:hypothetical protein
VLPQRWLYAILAFLSFLFAVEVLEGILRSPTLIWNEIRLTRSMALLHGLPLYPGERELGPIIGTLHTPVSHLLFLPAAAIHDPTTAILAGSLLACLLVFSAVAFALVRYAPAITSVTALIFLFCGFLIVNSEGAFNTAFFIHTDAAALAFATVACSLVAGRNGITTAALWMSALACALAVASKQTIAPVALAIALYVAIAEGGKRFAFFLFTLVVTGGSILAILLAVFPARAFLFNTLVLAAHRPLKPGYLQILADTYRMGRLEALPALLPILFLAIWTWTAPKQFFASNRWMVFLMASVAVTPVSVKAIVTVGSDVNHLGFVLYFLFVAAGLAIQEYFNDPNPATRLSARIFLTTGILVSLAPGMILALPASFRNLRANPSQTAYDYDTRHPSVAYFPFNPMTPLLRTGNLYHFDMALDDRDVAGHPLTPEQIRSGLPPGFMLVAVPPGEHIQSHALQGAFAGFLPITDPELPGWTVLRRSP